MRQSIPPLPFFLGLILALLLGGCSYKVPLVEEATVSIDRELLGTWEIALSLEYIPEEVRHFTATVFRLSPTEYIVSLSGDEYPCLCLRAYPVVLDGVQYLQLEMLDNGEGPDDAESYFIAKIALNDGQLTVSVLTLQKEETTSELSILQSPSGGYETTESLQRALHDHADDPDLFLPFAVGTRAPE
jgi:hypothetical protein